VELGEEVDDPLPGPADRRLKGHHVGNLPLYVRPPEDKWLAWGGRRGPAAGRAWPLNRVPGSLRGPLGKV